ncbi:hypothetical protein N7519_004427 [Penicillium mononematosum]|uniref:uncharacterized protein n=1 Tax=Penicillium mononematosum TaxID=268346 RepID=UPI0025497106|nr:uncharacterized protein N7519_004427 [Penicillium mononematosum]KAJ6189519.1 hypothetical protein N7519_004427 [Penicillium mononematosum]
MQCLCRTRLILHHLRPSIKPKPVGLRSSHQPTSHPMQATKSESTSRSLTPRLDREKNSSNDKPRTNSAPRPPIIGETARVSPSSASGDDFHRGVDRLAISQGNSDSAIRRKATPVKQQETPLSSDQESSDQRTTASDAEDEDEEDDSEILKIMEKLPRGVDPQSAKQILNDIVVRGDERAAAGREQTSREKKEGDASRVLVLAATNMPWDIDEAARRRFVRRQYIPLPEHHVREQQIRRLLSHQHHELSDADIQVLVQVTEGFSGSDITALAKDAAMGPLRNLGEALLHTPMDQIRAIIFQDFESSLYSIRPSVSSDGLRKYEDWAREFGERGG